MEEVPESNRGSQPQSPELGLPLPADDDEKLFSGFSTIFVASIQEAKDRISQIEYIFCNQLYPHFQNNSKLSLELTVKRRRIEELEREVDKGMALQKTLVDLVQSKESSLKDAEEKRKAAVVKSDNCEREKALLLGRIDDLDEKLRVKTREIEEMERLRELKRVEDEESHRKLLERVESLTIELQAEKVKRNRFTEAYKRLKSQHIYLRQKVGLTEESMLPQNKLKSESDLAMHQSETTEPAGLAFENLNPIISACELAKVKSEIPEEDFGGLEKTTPDVFVTECHANEVKEKTSEDEKGANLSPPSSFRGVQKCPSSSKSVSVSGTKRPASAWRQTRSHQSRVGPDPHDNFLDTPLENIRLNLNKGLNKEDLPHLTQNDISMNSSDEETQDLNAKSSPQKKQTSVTVANKRSFKYIEPVRKKADRENLKGVECKQCRKFYDAVLPDADGKDPDRSKQNIRCEHHDGVSRHRYRYVPPMTPEGFWNIGFESEL